MAKVERRPEGGGRLYVSIRKDDVVAFEQAATELEAATGLSVSRLIVQQMLEAYKKAQRQPREGKPNGNHSTARQDTH
jgi:hypothetical protein